MTAPAMTRIGPSESQSRALADRDSPYRDGHWSSVDARNRRRSEPPERIDALVAWCKREYENEIPDALHGSNMWVDHYDRGEREKGVQLVGSSDTGALAYTEQFRRILEADPHSTNRDGDLDLPFASALESMRKGRRHGHATIKALILMAHFDWRSMVGKPYTGRLPDHSRFVVRPMDEEVLEVFLKDALTALWFKFVRREAVG